MAGKFGSQSAVFLVDGYNLLASKVKALSYKIAAMTEPTDGMGDTWEEHTPTGHIAASITQGQAFFDTDTNRSHTALVGSVPTSPQATVRIISLGFAGNTIGESFTGFEGAFTSSYAVVGTNRELTKANADYTIRGRADQGLIIQHLAAQTVDWNTKTLGTPVDQLTAGTSGGAGYLEVTAYSGFSSVVFKLRDSSDNISYADYITFTTVTAAPYAQRVTDATNVDRYISVDGNVTGSGSITAFVGFAKF